MSLRVTQIHPLGDAEVLSEAFTFDGPSPSVVDDIRILEN